MDRALDRATSTSGRGFLGRGGAQIDPRALLVAVSLAVVYVVWGSTYFAMRIAVAGLPPYTMGGLRFVAAGALLFAFLRARGAPLPTASEWRGAAVVGLLFFAGGNGPIAIAEQHVSSGLAAVVGATMPVWAMVFAALWGERPRRSDVIAVLVGFGGVAILASGSELRGEPWAAILLVVAPASWALGSLASRRVALPAGAMATAAEMLVGGAAMFVIGRIRGEHVALPVPSPSLLAVLYLVAFGSLVGFSAYGYLLRNTRPAVFTSHAYVNPVVALALGAMLGSERITVTTVAGTAVILAGVAGLTMGRARRR